MTLDSRCIDSPTKISCADTYKTLSREGSSVIRMLAGYRLAYHVVQDYYLSFIGLRNAVE